MLTPAHAELALFNAFTKFKIPMFENRLNTVLGILQNHNILITKNFIEQVTTYYRTAVSSKKFSRHYLDVNELGVILKEIFIRYGLQYFDASFIKYLHNFETPITAETVQRALMYFVNLRPQIKSFKQDNPPWNVALHRTRYDRLIKNFEKYEPYFGDQQLNIKTAQQDHSFVMISNSERLNRSSPFMIHQVWYPHNQSLVIKKIAKGRREIPGEGMIEEIPYYTQYRMLQTLANNIKQPIIIKYIIQELIVNRITTISTNLFTKQRRYGHHQSAKMILGTPNGRNTEDLIYILKYHQDPTVSHPLSYPEDFNFQIDGMDIIFNLNQEIILHPDASN